MKKIILVAFSLVLFSESGFAGGVLPVSGPVDHRLYICTIPPGNTSGSKGLRLALLSLQGLVNRQKPRIFLSSGSPSEFLLKYYGKKGYFKTRERFTDPWKIIERFKNIAKGLVIF